MPGCKNSTAFLLALAIPVLAAELTIEVLDESGKPAWARVEVHGPGGSMHQPAHQPAGGVILSRRPGRSDAGSPYLRSFVMEGRCVLQLEPGGYRVVAERGLEFPRYERKIVLTGAGAKSVIRSRPWIRMRQRGWWSADMHVHRPMEEVPGLVQAEDLNLAVVFTMWNRQNLWAGKPLPADPVQQISPHHWMSVANAEDERGGGAWMLHHLAAPLGLETVVPAGAATTASWNPPGIEFVRAARAQRKPGSLFPWFDSEKPIWWEVPVMLALEPPDSLGLLHNHYNQYGMRGDEAWGRARDTKAFPGDQGFSDYSLDLIYRYWNLGRLIPLSAGAASGVLPNPVGYNRMYANIDGAFTVDKFYDAVKRQRIFVTNGPVLLWKPALTGTRLDARITVESLDPLDRIEVVANGKVIATLKSSGRVRADLSGHSWVAARCYVRNQATVRMAHTAPIPVPGKWNRVGDARYFIEWIDELITQSAGERQGLVPMYREARAFYEKLLR